MMDLSVTGVNGLWDVIAMLAILMCVVIGLFSWCIWIFCCRNRSRSVKKKKRGNGDPSEEQIIQIGNNDTDSLLENEEKPDGMDVLDESVEGSATRRKSRAWSFVKSCVQTTSEDVRKPSEDIQKTSKNAKKISQHQVASKANMGKLNYKVEYDFNSKILNVTVIQCSGLPAMDLNGFSDPFVKIYLMPDMKRKFVTKVHRKTLNPLFNETFQFKNLSYSDTFDKRIQFNVIDYDRFSKNDYIGEVIVPLSSIDLAQTIEEWKDISLKGNDQFLGDICFSLRYNPNAGKLTVGILECRNLKNMDAIGASDPYVNIKLLDQKGNRIEKKKTSVKKDNLNPYYHEGFVFDVKQELLREVTLELIVFDYDKIGSSDFIGKVSVGNNRKGLESKHWMEMLKNPRNSAVQWHALKEGDLEYKEERKSSRKGSVKFQRCAIKKKM